MLLLKNADILTMRQKGEYLKGQDVLLDGNKIAEIAPKISPDGKEVIDCFGRLLIPGMINAHLHSDENFFKGMFDNMPLEIWMLYSCPPLSYGPFSRELIYLRTMIGALEMVKCGVTCVQDDVSECPEGTFDGYDAVFCAYRDIGIKANVGLNMGSRKYCDKIPFVREYLPKEMQKMVDGNPQPDRNIELYKEVIDKWDGTAGHRVVMSTSAPQRCSDKYLMQALAFAKEYDLPMHSHMQESRIQHSTGKLFYGESVIKHTARIGFLSDRLSVIHGVWTDKEDMKLLADAGTTLISNPVSNLKLGSGIMPLIRMKKAGVNVVLGTDGMSSNDSQNMFEAMKYAGLLQKITTPDYREWLDSGDLLEMVYKNAAKSLKREGEIGVIAKGYIADIAIIDKNILFFHPENKMENHLVYCENGESVETVISNGTIICRNHKVVTVDEKAIIRKIQLCQEGFKEKYERTIKDNKKLEPYLKKIYDKCAVETETRNHLF